MKIYAHRGFSSKHPENTASAIEACRDLGIDGIEIDVQHTLDQRAVVIHDENLSRLCGVDKFLKDMSYEEVQKLRVLDGNEPPLLLEDYVDIVKDTELITNVELKTSIFEYPGIERDVYEIFKSRGLLDRLIVSSFNHDSLLKFREVDPQVPLAALTATKFIEPWDYLSKHQFDYFHPLFTTVDEITVNKLHAHDIKVNLWTVNDEKYCHMARDLGVDGIITNYPDLDFINTIE